MAEPPSTITTVNGRRCTRVRRTSTLLADNTATSPATSTPAAPGTQTTAVPSTAAPPLSSTEAALPVPAPAASLSSSPLSSLLPSLPSQSAGPGPVPSESASSELSPSGHVPVAGAQSSVSPSSPSTRFAAATTATGFIAFTSSSASEPASSAAVNTLPSSTSPLSSASQLASSAALNTLPSSTLPSSTLPSSTLPISSAQTGRSDTLTPVVSVVSSSTFTVSQPTGASDATFPSIAGGSDGSSSGSGTSSSTHNSNHSLSPGAIAGIVIGVLVGIVAIIALILFCIKKRKQRQEDQGEKSAGRDGSLAGSQARPLSTLAAKWAAFRAGVATKAGIRPTSASGAARRAPESPSFEPLSRSSYSSAGSVGSTRHLRSASAPAKPPPNRFAAFKQKFRRQQQGPTERRGRAVSTDSVPSFYSPTPPQLEDLPETLNPFRDPVPLQYHITNPDAPDLSPMLRTPQSVLLGDGLSEQQRAPLTPGSVKWRQPTPEFDFPASNQSENPFLDPVQRASTGSLADARRNSLSFPPMARVASHARTQSSGTNAMSQARSSWYSEDSGYNSPHHPSANIPPLRPGKNPFADRHATDPSTMPQKEADAASIYILPSSRQASLDSGKSPVGPIPLPSANSLMAMSMQAQEPLPTTSTYRSSWLNPQDSPASYYNSSARNSRTSKRRTAASRATKGKSDPFDLDRPEVLAVASNYGPNGTPNLSRNSNGSNWWKGIVDEGTGSGNGYESPSKRRTAAYAYGLAR